MALERVKTKPSPATYVALVFSIVACILALYGILFRQQKEPVSQNSLTQSSLERVKQEKKFRVGYGGFPPYTIINPQEVDPNKRVSGFCVDMINEIARRQSPPWEVEWHKASWESMRADMYSGKFDVFGDGIYMTPARAAEFLYTQPFSYFGVAVGVVRKNETRFKEFGDLDKENVTVSLPEGWTSTEYARQHLKKAKLRVIPVGDDLGINFLDVVNNRADIALQDVPTVLQFAREHSNEVKTLWIDNPPLRVAAGFIARLGDNDLIQFLNTSILVLQADGSLNELDKKWMGLGEYVDPQFKLGAGLKTK